MTKPPHCAVLSLAEPMLLRLLEMRHVASLTPAVLLAMKTADNRPVIEAHLKFFE